MPRLTIPAASRIAEGRHIFDKRTPGTGSRTAAFVRLARDPRDKFPSRHSMAGSARLAHYLRINRGQTV